MIVTTDATLGALTPGTVVESKRGKRYRLTLFVPAAGAVRAMWWAVPVTTGQRRRLHAGDFGADALWSVVTVAGPPTQATPVVVDYGLNRHLTVRHYVPAAADGGLADRGPSLCFRSIWKIVTSKPSTSTQASRLPTCRLCEAKARHLGMITRAA